MCIMKLIRLFYLLIVAVAFGNAGMAQDSVIITMVPIDTAVNSPFTDYAPVINADGSVMLYTSNRPTSAKGIKKQKPEYELVYQSNAIDSINWTKGVLLGEMINAPGKYNSPIALSNDGQRLLMYRDSPETKGDFYESVLHGTLWGELEHLGHEINTEHHESSASYAPDGKTLYFVSDRPDGMGGRDIWKSVRLPDGSFSEPENLGAPINTKKDEEGVFIHPDGRTMYFSSSGHGGMGGMDLFSAVQTDGVWAEPVNLGSPINTEGNEVFLVVAADHKVGYVTTEGIWGGLDIYKVLFERVNNTTTTETGLTLLKGIITDLHTGEFLEAEIELVNNETGEVVSVFNSNSATGAYMISLPGGFDYGISVTKKGYLFHSEHFHVPDTAAYIVVEKDVQLEKLEVGAKIVLNNIFYDYGKATLRPESKTELERLVKIMNDNPEIRIEIGGHTDTRGSDSFNQQLSEDRAQSVVNYLIDRGIDEGRMVYKGYGEEQTVYSDADIEQVQSTAEKEELHQLNRRTELTVIE